MMVRVGPRWETLCRSELRERVREIAAALRAYGAEPGDLVAILSPPRLEAAIVDLAIHLVGGVGLALDPGLGESDLLGVLRRVRPRQVLVSDTRQLDKIVAIRPELASLEIVLLFDAPLGDRRTAATSLKDALAVGTEVLARDPTLLDGARVASGEHPARLIARRARGEPEDVVLSQANLIAGTRALAGALPLGPDDVVLSSLPVTRASRHELELLCLFRGAVLATAGDPAKIGDDLVSLRPTMLVAASDHVEELARRIEPAVRSRGWPVRAALGWAIERGSIRARDALARGQIPVGGGGIWRVADRLALGRLRLAHFGGKLRVLVSVGRPLPPSARNLLFACGFVVLEGWDVDAASGIVALNRIEAVKPGTVGRVLDGVEIRAVPPGRMYLGGPMVATGENRIGAGPVASGRRIEGAAGSVDADGFLTLEAH